MRKEVIIIEDNPDDAELIKIALKRSSGQLKLKHFLSGSKAIDYLHSDSHDEQDIISLIILDLKMDGMTGFDVIRELRNHVNTLYVPIVIFSSSGLVADMVQSYKLGANGYVQKPVDGDLFFKKLFDIGNFWLHTNQFPQLNQQNHD